MDRVSESRQVLDNAELVDPGHDYSCHIARLEFLIKFLKRSSAFFLSEDSKRNSVIESISLNSLDDIRKHCSGNQDPAFVLCAGNGHLHSLCGSRGSVIERSVADIQSRQFAHHTLVLENVAQSALGNLSLVRCVSSQKFGARSYVRDN